MRCVPFFSLFSCFARPRVSARAAAVSHASLQVPITVRLAWHASGTFDKKDGSGGSDGARMRFEPEVTDDANKGLRIVQDLLKPVKEEHPELSIADIWTMASCAAVEFAGGPKIPHALGRSDEAHDRRMQSQYGAAELAGSAASAASSVLLAALAAVVAVALL